MQDFFNYYIVMTIIASGLSIAGLRVIAFSTVQLKDGKTQVAITNMALSFVVIWYLQYVLSPLAPGTTMAEVRDKNGELSEIAQLTESETAWHEYADVIKQAQTGNEIPELEEGQYTEIWVVKSISMFDIKMACKSGCKKKSKTEFSMTYPDKWLSIVSWFSE